MKFSVEWFDADGNVMGQAFHREADEVDFRGIVEDMRPGYTVTITRTDCSDELAWLVVENTVLVDQLGWSVDS